MLCGTLVPAMRREYTAEFDGFHEALNREAYRYLSGQKTAYDTEPIFDRYADLFRKEEIDELAVDIDAAYTERDRKACRFLRAAAVEQYLETRVRALTEEIARHESRAVVRLNGREIPFHATRGLIANEPRTDVRREIAARRERIIEETNDLRAERLETLHEHARTLGAESYGALWSGLLGIDYAALSTQCAAFLSATERPFHDALEVVLRERAGVPLGEATRADVLRATRFSEVDRAFSGARLPVVYRDVFAGLGIRTGAQRNIALDLADRPTKHPRPFCVPIRRPEEVKLVIRPSGGFSDYQELLHEAGHAQHFGVTSPDVRVEFRRAGDRATSEVFAFLFESLAYDRDWLQETFGLGEARAFLGAVAFERCFRVRRYAGKMIYEEELHSGRKSLASASARYEEALEEATRVRTGRAEYLADVDDGFYTADYLRAWALEVRLRDHLKTRFGRRWWTHRPAGDLLKEVWSSGDEYTADELARELGLGAIEFDSLEADLVGGLKP